MDNAGESSPPVRPLAIIPIAAVCAIYVAARLWRLTDSCLWFDEIFSVHAAEHPWSGILSFIALDLIHPPLFYALLKLWVAIGGESVFWLRLLPVTFSCLAIIPFILLCRELKQGVWVTTLALFFLAVNGSLIKYAQEIRMYSLLMCLSLFSIWLFARYFNRGKSFVWLLPVNILLVYSHYFGWFVVAAEVAAILVLLRRQWRPVALMFGVVFAGFIPWMIVVWRAGAGGAALGQNIGWVARPGPREIVAFVFDVIEPFYYQAISITEPPTIYRVSIPLILIVLAACALYVRSWKDRPTEEQRSVYLLATFAGVPLTLAFAASWLLPYSIWGTRHLIIIFAPISLLFAIALTSLAHRRARVFLLTMVFLFTGYSFALQAERSNPQYSWCAFELLAQRIEADGRGPVFAIEDLAAYHLWFAFRTNTDEKMRARVIRADNFRSGEQEPFFIPRGLDDEYLRRGDPPAKGGQFWLVYRAADFDTTKPPLDKPIQNGYKITLKESVKGDDWDAFAVFVESPEGR